MYNHYPFSSKYSFFNKESLDDNEVKNSDFISALVSDFSHLQINTSPESPRLLIKKVEEIAGSEILEDRSNKYQRLQCMHLVHMMNLVSSGWNQSKAWWHTPFSLDKSKPLSAIEHYRHDEVVYRDLVSFREMLNKRINILPLMDD